MRIIHAWEGGRSGSGISLDPNADRQNHVNKELILPYEGWNEIRLDDPDLRDTTCTGKIVLKIGRYLDVLLPTLNDQYTKERHTLVKCSDYRKDETRYLGVTGAITLVPKQAQTLPTRRRDVNVTNFSSSTESDGSKWPVTYAVGKLNNSTELHAWSRSAFRTKYGAKVDEEVNEERKSVGQKPVSITKGY